MIRQLFVFTFLVYAAYGCIGTAPVHHNENRDVKKSYKALYGNWSFVTKTCITGSDTTVQTSQRGGFTRNHRPPTYLKFNKDGTLSVYVDRHPNLDLLRDYIPVWYTATWKIEKQSHNDLSQYHLVIVRNVIGQEECEFSGLINFLNKQKLVVGKVDSCLIEWTKSSRKL